MSNDYGIARKVNGDETPYKPTWVWSSRKLFMVGLFIYTSSILFCFIQAAARL